MATLETRVKEYIKEHSKNNMAVRIPLAIIADELNSSTASVWRAIKKLEGKRIIKVVKPKVKTEPNSIYYLGEQDELNALLEDLMVKTGHLLIIMREIKKKVKEKDDKIFELEQQLKKLNR